MVEPEAKIKFSELQQFPAIDGSNSFKIHTRQFLDCSYQIVNAIACFGKLFSPIIKDMRGNVERIENKYTQNEELFQYLEDLILKDKDGNDNPYDTVTDALLWLKRALEMIEQFFRNMLNDDKRGDQVKSHLKNAYDQCLLPYHGFLAQKAFQLLHHYVPSRTVLLGSSDKGEDNLKALEDFLICFRANLDHLNEFFDRNDLNKNYKA